MSPSPLLRHILLALAIVSAVPRAACADFPTQPVTLIVPFAAGGPSDLIARIIARHLAVALGQAVMIENITGAAGTTAALRTKRAKPDGYTVILGHLGTHAAVAATSPALPYDPVTDFVPIGLVAEMPIVVLARKGLPAHSLEEFIRALKGDTLRMAHAGKGSVSHAFCQYLNNLIDASPEFVAFNGTGPAMKALIHGDVDYMCDQIVTAVPHVRAQTIQAVAVASESRHSVLPEVPTSSEAGLPQFRGTAWNALFAPIGTPDAVISQFNRALSAALDDPSTRRELEALGAVLPQGTARTPSRLTALIKIEIGRWSGILRRIY